MDITSYCRLFVIAALFSIALSVTEFCDNENCGVASSEGNETRSRLLSRTKRFIVFPDGSSFQLGELISL